MPDPCAFDYAVIRIVPRIDREEFINAGVIVFSPQKRFLEARTFLDHVRLRTLWPSLDQDLVKRHLHAISQIAEGAPDAGPIAQLSQSQRFHWLTSPRSTIIQTSPVRTGLASQPESMLEHLANEFVGVNEA